MTGSFPVFQSNILFHPEALDRSKAEVTIDMVKVTTDYEKAKDMIGTADWLSVQSFPKATFATRSFKSLGGKRYEAACLLTIKNISVPTVLTFTLDEFSADAAKITGEAVIHRKDFKIGWDDTGSVANDVKVLVSLTAKASKP